MVLMNQLLLESKVSERMLLINSSELAENFFKYII